MPLAGSHMQPDDQEQALGPGALPPLPEAYDRALALIDLAHAEDARRVDGPDGPTTVPYELHYARKMTKWLATRYPTASPTLQLACRAQHFRRWELPRTSFPMNRAGYLTWRAKQRTQAASKVVDLLASPGHVDLIPTGELDRVAALLRKANLASDEETQVLEDVACLVFLDDQLDDFDSKPNIDEDKMVSILRKTWAKMSEPGRKIALGMSLSPRAQALISKALNATD